MNRTTVGLALCAALCATASIWSDPAAAATVFVDTFESGTPDTQIPANGTPWRVNDSGQTAFYRSTNNPFASGNVYARLNDTSNTQGTRLMSTNAADTGGLGPSIFGQVTTLSFDFWETLPDVDTPSQPGLGFGYYATGTIDLNAGGRNFRAFLHNGQLSPDALVAGSGSPVAYARESVHTVFMVANDTAAAVANYRDGQTLDPDQADVWISLAGADPVYAFSVNKQNPDVNPHGIGFRSFNPDIEEFYLDNVLLVSGASFDRSQFNIPEPTASAACLIAVGILGWCTRRPGATQRDA